MSWHLRGRDVALCLVPILFLLQPLAWAYAQTAGMRSHSFQQFPQRLPMSDRVPSPGVFKFKDLPLTDQPQTRTTETGIEVTPRIRPLTAPWQSIGWPAPRRISRACHEGGGAMVKGTSRA